MRTSTRASTWKRESNGSIYSHPLGLSDEPVNIASPSVPDPDHTTLRRSLREAGQPHQLSGSPGLTRHFANTTGSIRHCRIEGHRYFDAATSDLGGAPEVDYEDPFPPDKQPRAPKRSTQASHQHYRPHTPNISNPPQPLGSPCELRSEPNVATQPQESGLNIRTPERSSAPSVPQPPRVTTNPQVVPQFFAKSATITSIQVVPATRPVITIDDVYTKYIRPKGKPLTKYLPLSRTSDLFVNFPSLEEDLHDLKGYGNGRDQVGRLDTPLRHWLHFTCPPDLGQRLTQTGRSADILLSVVI